MAIWGIIAGIVKGVAKGAAKAAAKGATTASKAIATVGKTAVKGTKAIGHVGKEFGKGAIGMETKSSPLNLSQSMGSGANMVAKTGQYANQLGQFLGSQTGTDQFGNIMSNQGGSSTPSPEKPSNPLSGQQVGSSSNSQIQSAQPKPFTSGNQALQTINVLSKLSSAGGPRDNSSQTSEPISLTHLQGTIDAGAAPSLGSIIDPQARSRLDAVLASRLEEQRRLGGY